MKYQEFSGEFGESDTRFFPHEEVLVWTALTLLWHWSFMNYWRATMLGGLLRYPPDTGHSARLPCAWGGCPCGLVSEPPRLWLSHFPEPVRSSGRSLESWKGRDLPVFYPGFVHRSHRAICSVHLSLWVLITAPSPLDIKFIVTNWSPIYWSWGAAQFLGVFTTSCP